MASLAGLSASLGLVRREPGMPGLVPPDAADIEELARWSVIPPALPAEPAVDEPPRPCSPIPLDPDPDMPDAPPRPPPEDDNPMPLEDPMRGDDEPERPLLWLWPSPVLCANAGTGASQVAASAAQATQTARTDGRGRHFR